MAGTAFIVKSEHLPSLSWLLGKDSNRLSPWTQVEGREPGEKEWQSLIDSGLAAEDRRIKQDVVAVTGLLQNPVRFVRMRLISGSTLMEHLVYACNSGAESVVVTPEKDGLLIRYPAPIQIILRALREYWGCSTLVSSKLDLELDKTSALVFAALTDLHRRSILGERALMKSAAEKVFSSEEILAAMTNTPADGQWLFNAVRQLAGNTAAGSSCALSKEECDSAIRRLQDREVVETNGAGHRLVKEGLSFGNGFLVFSQALHIDLGARMPDGQIVRTNALWLQAGLHENLHLEADHDQIIMEVVSSSLILDLLGALLIEGFDSSTLEEQDDEDTAADASREADLEDEAEPMQSDEQDTEMGKADASLMTPPPAEVVAEPEQVPASVPPPPPAPVSVPPPPPASDPQPSIWHIYSNQEQRGPYTWDDLCWEARSGLLKPDDLIWSEGMDDWAKAADRPGLF